MTRPGRFSPSSKRKRSTPASLQSVPQGIPPVPTGLTGCTGSFRLRLNLSFLSSWRYITQARICLPACAAGRSAWSILRRTTQLRTRIREVRRVEDGLSARQFLLIVVARRSAYWGSSRRMKCFKMCCDEGWNCWYSFSRFWVVRRF